ncbi:MAG: amidohydrolase family protein [Vicinamibacterales bacterium]|jgi:imidazolonepropionase-like amidohydrolase|nr:amidohydrolase [Acidobacteriota bacterium]MDP7294854.1 amidohydrolase family protein [Vicinamibacterales bacterium]MDP7472174.1 amidohydrolase family protein [Vicinamibacterales bacterium]MDP7670880.1 amidohydrolase family protein [Vicinamibacterales bacterium]HJO39625.1 amidohydrolase family protein [Vicinamibacterales bacterium]|tara:strand:- start:842 stop:2143 length:1302 start_codon:yes stop_codon:yes gene_type:complete
MTPARRNVLVCTLAALTLAGCGESVVELTPGLTAFTGARIIDGTGNAIDAGVLVVRDGRVEAVGAAESVSVPVGAEEIDLTGRTIMPGLINAHGHVGATRGLESNPDLYTRENLLHQLDLYARYGITTVFSLGGDGQDGFDLRNEQDLSLDRARLFVAGPVVVGETAEEVETIVDGVAGMGADIVKIRVDDNLGSTTKMPEEAWRAVIARAHEHGLRVAAHVFYLDDAKKLVEADVDFLAHSVRDTDVDQELIDMMVEHNVCLSPTLLREVSTFVYESRPDFFDDPFFLRNADAEAIAGLEDPERQARVQNSASARGYKAALEVAMRNVKALADGGVRLAFGTDTGPVGRFQGYFEQLELERMVEAGLTPAQAIQSATGDAAACMEVADDLGTLAMGTWADFVVLTADPLDDILNTREIESVWIAGNSVPLGN